MKFKNCYKCKFDKHLVETVPKREHQSKNWHRKIFTMHTFSYANAEKNKNKNVFNIFFFSNLMC